MAGAQLLGPSCFWHSQRLLSHAQDPFKKRQGCTSCRHVTIFVDDISMPAIDDWGDQATRQTVRQLPEQGDMHLLEKPIGDMNFIKDRRSDWQGCITACCGA